MADFVGSLESVYEAQGTQKTAPPGPKFKYDAQKQKWIKQELQKPGQSTGVEQPSFILRWLPTTLQSSCVNLQVSLCLPCSAWRKSIGMHETLEQGVTQRKFHASITHF